jgi:hypothetical protein
MRIRESILGKPGPESSARYRVAPPDRVNEWDALVSTFKQLFIQDLQTNYFTGSRTSDTQTLCATVSARRLCGN